MTVLPNFLCSAVVVERHVVLEPRRSTGSDVRVGKGNNVQGVSMRFSSGLYGPCFGERFFRKKSLDDTLVVKITDLIYFHRHYTVLHSFTIQYTTPLFNAIQYNTIYSLLSLSVTFSLCLSLYYLSLSLSLSASGLHRPKSAVTYPWIT
jgi:hypothetical protein